MLVISFVHQILVCSMSLHTIMIRNTLNRLSRCFRVNSLSTAEYDIAGIGHGFASIVTMCAAQEVSAVSNRRFIGVREFSEYI